MDKLFADSRMKFFLGVLAVLCVAAIVLGIISIAMPDKAKSKEQKAQSEATATSEAKSTAQEEQSDATPEPTGTEETAVTATPEVTEEPIVTATPEVTETPAVTATPMVTEEPTATPTEAPTEVPTPTPVPTPKVEIDYKDIEESVPYGTTYIDDETMPVGETRLVSAGEEGIITKVYEFKIIDGVREPQDQWKLVATKNTKEPVNEVIAKGTIDTFYDVNDDPYFFTKKIECVATAYADDEEWGNLVYWTNELGGLTTRWGCIAVDPDVIPLGTKVYVQATDDKYNTKDYGFAIACDIGKSITGYKVDLWMDDREVLMHQWGVRNVNVYILEDQSVDVFELRGDYEWEP